MAALRSNLARTTKIRTTHENLFSLLLFSLGAVHASLGAAAEPEPRPVASKPLDYMIVVTGGELLEGVYPDAHTPYLTRILRPLGCRCVGSLTVDDNRDGMSRRSVLPRTKRPW